jgi:hypothetical protein
LKQDAVVPYSCYFIEKYPHKACDYTICTIRKQTYNQRIRDQWHNIWGISMPSFCGRPIIWLKQQSPFVLMSSLLCSVTYHIQNGLPCRRSNSSLREFSFCCCETSFCRSLNTIVTLNEWYIIRP